MSEPGGGGSGRDSRPYESLYRHGDPTPPERTDPGWARHSGIHHDPADSPEDDRYAWLFRSEDPAPAHALPDPGVVEEDTRLRLPPVADPAQDRSRDRSADLTTAVSPSVAPVAPPVPPPVAPPTPVRPSEEPAPPRRRAGLVVLVVVLVALLVAGGWWLLRGDFDATGATGPSATGSATSGSEAPSSSASDPSGSASDPWSGAVAAVAPSAVTAGCTAPDATDDGGAKVSYAAGQVADGDTTTAWRCNGSGRGEQLSIDLPSGTTVAELGLTNGYTKVDPTSKKDRYSEYRRILAVTWTVGDRSVRQTLSGTDEQLQTIRIPPTAADQVVLHIDSASAPGSSASTRNAVLISEVTVGSPA